MAEAELSTEIQWLKELHEQALEGIRKKDEQAAESRRLLEEMMKCRDLEEKMGAVREQVTRVRDVGELERHRAVEAEHLKWEACEAHLVAQLEAQTGSGQVEPG